MYSDEFFWLSKAHALSKKITSELQPVVREQFLKSNGIEGAKQYAGLYCLSGVEIDLKREREELIRFYNKTPNFDDYKISSDVRLFTGLVKDRRRCHAEKDLVSKLMADPSRIPGEPVLVLYSYYSPCRKCVTILKDFIRACRNTKVFVLIYEEIYQPEYVDHFILSLKNGSPGMKLGKKAEILQENKVYKVYIFVSGK